MYWYEPEPEPDCIIHEEDMPENLTYAEGLEFCAFSGCPLCAAELDEWNRDLALQDKYPHI